MKEKRFLNTLFESVPNPPNKRVDFEKGLSLKGVDPHTLEKVGPKVGLLKAAP